jgi:ribosome biogenesis GTPase / thiamine phosphate phosphatase
LTGTVIKSTGSWYLVDIAAGQPINCRIKGKLRLKGYKTTNPVAVGDKVVIEISENESVGIIKDVLPRRNHIIRKSTNLSKVSHIIAANIDLALLVVTIREPRIATGFIDRFLVNAEAYHINAAIVFNKTDIYEAADMTRLVELRSIYEDAGYVTLAVSAITGENVEYVKQTIKDKVNLFSGISGVGKSALVNAIEPGLRLKTGDISSYHKKGKHTTTFPEMHKLSFGGFVIDTPGIKEFGLVEFRKHEIAERFPEFRRYQHDCRFNNCTHIHEPGCAVKTALEEGKIAASRYENYLRIIDDDYLEKELWEWE